MRQETDEQKQRAAIGKRAGLVGLLCNFLLAGGKLAVGTLAASMAIFADGLNNLSDGASSLVTLLGFKLGERPADPEHPYGHARYEYLAALTVAVMILVIGVELAKSSLHKILNPAPITFSWLMLAVLVGSILVKAWMMFFYKKQGKKINSTTLLAAAEDSRNDVLTTAAVLAAVLVEKLSGWQIDGIMGILVAAFILFSGAKLAKETLSPLLGEGATKELAQQVTAYIKSFPLVLGCHDLMVHDYGPNQKFATVHVEMDAKEDPLVCHNIIDNIERRMLAQHHIHLTIHYDPVVTDDAELQEIRALLTKTLHAIDPGLSLHDLRMVRGPEHTNLVFDLVVPAALQGERAALQAKINASLPQDAGHRYYTVITYDSPDFN